MSGKKRKISIVKIRGVISPALLADFILLTVTGLRLWLLSEGTAAAGNDFQRTVHTYAGFLMVGLVLIHLLLNYRMLVSEVKALFRMTGKK